jgi:hypothetical protein
LSGCEARRARRCERSCPWRLLAKSTPTETQSRFPRNNNNKSAVPSWTSTPFPKPRLSKSSSDSRRSKTKNLARRPGSRAGTKVRRRVYRISTNALFYLSVGDCLSIHRDIKYTRRLKTDPFLLQSQGAMMDDAPPAPKKTSCAYQVCCCGCCCP